MQRYCSRIWLVRSVCPSVSGWYAVLRLDQTPRRVQSKAQKHETKSFPLLETMSAGVPCLVKMFCRKIFASCGASMSDLVGMKWAILVSRSTTTNIISKPSETGNHLIKSMDMEDQGLSGIGSGPYGLCLTVLSWRQVVHAFTYLVMSWKMLGQ